MIRKLEWVAIAFSIVAMAWMVTEGTWDFFGTSGHLESFFDAQAESLLHGRIDVPPESISYEAWVRDGKTYGYFGPTPALFRLPLVALFPEMKGHWSRLSMLAAALVGLAAVWMLLQLVELGWLRPVFLLAACIGSPHYFILSESKVYQEASAWGASLSLLSLVCLARHLREPRRRWLAIGCVTAFLAFQARVSTGAGPLVALLLAGAAMAVPRLRAYFGVAPGKRAAIAMVAATLALSAFAWSGLNKWKFGRWLTSQPIELNLEFSKQRLAMVKGELLSVANIPATMSVYLNPANITFPSAFPWVAPVVPRREELAMRFPSAHLDKTADVVGLPIAVPGLFFGALAGTVLLLGRWGERLRVLRAPLCGAAAGCGVIFLFGYMTIRYLDDLYPWLTIGSAAGLALIPWRKPSAAAFAALTVYGMWVMFGLAFVEQRWLTAPISTERHLATLDLFTASREGGVSGLVSYWTHWRTYVAATSFQSGNLRADGTFIPYRPTQTVARSGGAPPFGAQYAVEIPADGQYELSIRYASVTQRPVVLSINGRAVGYVCTVATGGDQADNLKWTFGGRHALSRGQVTIGLASNSEFPVLQALRLVRVD